MLVIVAALIALDSARLDAARADAECLIAGLTLAERAALSQPYMEGREPERGAFEPVVMARARCSAQEQWIETRAEVAGTLAVTSLLQDRSRATLEGSGIPTSHIDRWFAEQTMMVRTNPRVQTADMYRLMTSLRRGGLSMQTLSQQAEAIGLYISTLVTAARVGEGMPLREQED